MSAHEPVGFFPVYGHQTNRFMNPFEPDLRRNILQVATIYVIIHLSIAKETLWQEYTLLRRSGRH